MSCQRCRQSEPPGRCARSHFVLHASELSQRRHARAAAHRKPQPYRHALHQLIEMRGGTGWLHVCHPARLGTLQPLPHLQHSLKAGGRDIVHSWHAQSGSASLAWLATIVLGTINLESKNKLQRTGMQCRPRERKERWGCPGARPSLTWMAAASAPDTMLPPRSEAFFCSASRHIAQ